MTAQWIRKASLIIGDGEGALDLSALHFAFTVSQSDINTPNRAEIRVYNVSDATAKRARDLEEGGTVVLSAGYDGNFGTIFQGTIIQVLVGKESPTDSFIDIVAGDGDLGYCMAVVHKAMAAGATVRDRIGAALEALAEYGIKRGQIEQDLPEQPLPRGTVLHGMAREVLDDAVASSDATWWIQNGELHVVKGRAYLPGEAVVLTSKTGLVGLPVQSIDGISMRCLLNPLIQPGRVIQIDNRSIQQMKFMPDMQSSVQFGFVPRLDADGFYRAIVVNHLGDSHGQDWYTEIVGVALDGPPISNGLLEKGYAIPPGV